jgi:hypothetical protein
VAPTGAAELQNWFVGKSQSGILEVCRFCKVLASGLLQISVLSVKSAAHSGSLPQAAYRKNLQRRKKLQQLDPARAMLSTQKLED